MSAISSSPFYKILPDYGMLQILGREGLKWPNFLLDNLKSLNLNFNNISNGGR